MITCKVHSNDGKLLKEFIGEDEHLMLDELKNDYKKWSPILVKAEFKFPDSKIASVSLEYDHQINEVKVTHWKPLIRYS